ncbi:MAG: LCP family protein [Micromonosporaceae bacterium]|nr:LCP family protein [Micromonosporaceae bacterium]
MAGTTQVIDIPGTGEPQADGRRRASPLWARLCLVVGILLTLSGAGGVAGIKLMSSVAFHSVDQQNLLGDAGIEAESEGRVEIAGAKTILLVGADARPEQPETDLVRSDSIMLAHIPASHESVYMVSIPRDTVVRIPPSSNGEFRYAGGIDKINAAYAYGGKDLSGGEAKSAGVNLLAKTIKKEFGVSCDAAAIVDFDGFREVVKAIGGVDMYVDQETTSIHIGFTRDGKVKIPFKQVETATGVRLIPIAGVKPKVYHVGYQHLTPHAALDFVRQRETLPNSDYDRQRHQQQFVKAVVRKTATREVLANPVRLGRVVGAMGRSMTLDTGGIAIEDWIYAMRNIRGDDVVTLKTNNGTFHSADSGRGEAIDSRTRAMLKAFENNTIEMFVAANPDLVTQS